MNCLLFLKGICRPTRAPSPRQILRMPVFALPGSHRVGDPSQFGPLPAVSGNAVVSAQRSPMGVWRLCNAVCKRPHPADNRLGPVRRVRQRNGHWSAGAADRKVFAYVERQPLSGFRAEAEIGSNFAERVRRWSEEDGDQCWWWRTKVAGEEGAALWRTVARAEGAQAGHFEIDRYVRVRIINVCIQSGWLYPERAKAVRPNAFRPRTNQLKDNTKG